MGEEMMSSQEGVQVTELHDGSIMITDARKIFMLSEEEAVGMAIKLNSIFAVRANKIKELKIA